jgi:hypothetical protein
LKKYDTPVLQKKRARHIQINLNKMSIPSLIDVTAERYKACEA